MLRLSEPIWACSIIAQRTIATSLKINHSEQPGKLRKQGKICLSGAYTRCCYCVRSELFCPRCLNEQLFAAPLRASNVCDDGSFSSPKECALAPFSTKGYCPATPEQRKGGLDFRCAGAFRSFGRQKNIKERLEEKYKWTIKVEDCRRMQWWAKARPTTFLRPFTKIFLSGLLIYVLVCTKFLLSTLFCYAFSHFCFARLYIGAKGMMSGVFLMYSRNSGLLP